MNPRNNVSAVIPVRNGAFWIPQFLEKVIPNFHSNDEIIFIDDSSEDETMSLLKSAQSRYSNLFVVTNPAKGIVSALNFGISQATHDLIARFDIDDLYSNLRIDTQINSIGENHGACFADYSFYGNGIINLGYVASAVYPIATKLSLFKSQRTAHSSALFRKQVFIEAGGYLEEEFPAEDLGLWVRMAKIATLVTAPEELLFYNLRTNSTSSERRVSAFHKKDLIVKKNLNLFENVIRDFKMLIEEYQSYNLHSHSFERKFHLLREILGVNQELSLQRKHIKWLSIEFTRLAIKSESFKELVLLNHFRRKRNDFRKRL